MQLQYVKAIFQEGIANWTGESFLQQSSSCRINSNLDIECQEYWALTPYLGLSARIGKPRYWGFYYSSHICGSSLWKGDHCVSPQPPAQSCKDSVKAGKKAIKKRRELYKHSSSGATSLSFGTDYA